MGNQTKMTLLNSRTSFVAYAVALLSIACHVNESSTQPQLDDEMDQEDDIEMTIDEILSKIKSTAKPDGGTNGTNILLNSDTRSDDNDGTLNSSDEFKRIVELDILITKEQWDEREKRFANSSSRSRRSATTDYLWPNSTIPYLITHSDENNAIIRTAMKTVERYTCVKFQDVKPDDIDYVDIQSGDGCLSYVGRKRGPQSLILATKCFKEGGKIVIHELAHAIGLQHEHSRPDRDDYITVALENIDSNYEHDFKKVDNADPYIGIPYSYLSLMHYGKNAFAKERKQTIQAKKKKYQDRMGKTKTLNFEDVKLINNMYRCAAHCPETSCPGDSFVGKDCNCWCPSIYTNSSAMPCYEYTKACGGTYYAVEKPQYLRSPGYPQNYTHRISCAWTLLTQSGNGSISLQFTHFSTEECCDRVVIFDNAGNEIIISGTKNNVTLIVGHHVTISFTSDDHLEDTGFEIKFAALSENTTNRERTVRSQNDKTFGAASYSFQVPLSSAEVAVTHHGTLILRSLHGSLTEYLPGGRPIDRWIPLKQSMHKVDEVQDVATLSDGRVSVSVLNSQVVLLFRRSVADSTFGGEWIEDPPLMKLQSSPWRLSTFGDTLAVAERRFNEANDWVFGQQLSIWNLTSGEQRHALRRDYDIYSMALTYAAVVTTSFKKLKLNNVTETYVVDAHNLRDDQRLWRYEVDDFVVDMCTDLAGRKLYAAMRSSNGSSGRVAAIDMVDGKELQHNILSGASLFQPTALSVGKVLGLSESALIVLSSDPTSKQFKTVTVHQSQVI